MKTNRYINIIPPLMCKNGTKLSVQGSSSHYSTPNENVNFFKEVEVGFIEQDGMRIFPDKWEKYGDEEYSDVYGYVPVELVYDFIKSQEGLIESEEIYFLKIEEKLHFVKCCKIPN